MRRSSLLSLALLSLAFFPVAPSARAAGQALSGVVRTPQGSPVPQVLLHVDGPGGSHALATGPDGGFRLAGLEPGVYAVKLDAPGFILSPEPKLRLEAGEDASIDLVLEPAPVREHVVVSATRGEAMTSTLGTTVSVIDGARIADRESTSFLNLMQDVPGATVARSGGVGAQGTVFLRGGASNFARVLVDGVPVNEPGGAWNFGPQLRARARAGRGGEGGGEQPLQHRRPGGGHPSLDPPARARRGPELPRRGRGGELRVAALRGGLVGAGRAVRLERRPPAPRHGQRRAQQQVPGNLGRPHRGSDAQRALEPPTGGAGGRQRGRDPGPHGLRPPRSRRVVRLHECGERPDLPPRRAAGGPRPARRLRDHHQLSKNPLDSGSFIPQSGDLVAPFPYSDYPDPLGFQNDTRRFSTGYQADIQADARNLVSAGVDLEHESGEIGSRSDTLLSPTRTNVGAYVQDRLAVGGFFATVGARVEHNDSFGTKVVPRVALAYRVRGGNDATTLRASGGAGIKEPDFFQSFGISSFALGNPDLEPERSRTFDLGVEQRLFAGRARAEVSYFHHEYRDQIAYQYDFATGTGTYLNLGKTRGQGLEVALAASPLPSLSLSAEYTYLDGEILVSTNSFDPVYAEGEPLLRRPRHQGSFSARYGGRRVSVGASLVRVGERADSDFVGIGLTTNEAYTRVDARLHARIVGGLSAYLAAENLFDQQYQEVLGYPALGRSVRVGLRFRSQDGARP